MKTPSPSHHGHTTGVGVPPRPEISLPVPRQGGQGIGACSAGSWSATIATVAALASGPVRADGRYAPSPTGPLHLGNLRTALIAWLSARSQGSRFVVRMEDLDQGRVRPDRWPFVIAPR